MHIHILYNYINTESKKNKIKMKEKKFHKVKNDDKNKLKDDIKRVHSSNKTLTPADKTLDMHKLEKKEYKHLVTNAITSSYKKARKDVVIKINQGVIKFERGKI